MHCVLTPGTMHYVLESVLRRADGGLEKCSGFNGLLAGHGVVMCSAHYVEAGHDHGYAGGVITSALRCCGRLRNVGERLVAAATRTSLQQCAQLWVMTGSCRRTTVHVGGQLQLLLCGPDQPGNQAESSRLAYTHLQMPRGHGSSCSSALPLHVTSCSRKK